MAMEDADDGQARRNVACQHVGFLARMGKVRVVGRSYDARLIEPLKNIEPCLIWPMGT